MSRKTNTLKREVNFFDALERYELADKKKQKSPVPAVSLLVSALLLMSAGYGLWLHRDLTKGKEAIAVMQQYVENSANQEGYDKKSKLWSESSQLRAYNEACEKYIAQLEGIPRLESGDFSDLIDLLPVDAREISYVFSDPNLTISCETENKDAPARFAQNLTETRLFQSVSYDGFVTRNEDSDVYTFSITCQLW